MNQNHLSPCDPYMESRDADDHAQYGLLTRRGSTLLRLAFALAYEAQLTSEEICALNACDFDFVGARVAIMSMPDTFDRFAEFGIVTAIEFFEWAKLRDGTVDDGFFGALLHDRRGSRLTPEYLQAAFEEALCQPRPDDAPDAAALDVFDLELVRA